MVRILLVPKIINGFPKGQLFRWQQPITIIYTPKVAHEPDFARSAGSHDASARIAVRDVGFSRARLDQRSLFQKKSEKTARQVGFALSMAVDELELIIDSDDVLHGTADVPYLQNHILRSRYFESVTIYDEQGEEQLSTREDNPHSGGSERLFKQASQGSTCISRPNADGVDEAGGRALVFVPVKGLKRPGEQVIVGVVPLFRIWSAVDVELFDDDVALTLLRARTADTSSAENADESHAILSAANHPDTYYVKESVPRRNDIQGPAWRLVAIWPYGHVRAELERNAVVNVIAAILTLGVLGFVGVRFSRRVYPPLKELTSACNGILRGRLHIKIPHVMPDELQRISNAVAHMISEVRYHRNTMSEMVRSRTQNLEAVHLALERRADNLKASYNSSKDGVLVLGSDGLQFHEVNQPFIELFGLSEVDPKTLDVDSLFEAMTEVFMDGTDFSVRWSSYQENPDGECTEEWELAQPERKVISVFTAPVRNEESVITGRYWTFREITRQRHQEEHFRQEQRLDAMGLLAGNFAHDIDNLLTVILGNLSLALLETDDRPDVAECLSTAACATNDATALAKRLLGFANGGGPLTLGTANVRFRDGEFGMPPEKTAGDFVRITIEDVGCGMSDAVGQRMFEPFFSTKKDEGRQGLGLAMAYGTIQRHGGWINCESTSGVGSRFEVYVIKVEERGKN